MEPRYRKANKDLAQEELKALSDINAENKDKTGYDANKLKRCPSRYQVRTRQS